MRLRSGALGATLALLACQQANPPVVSQQTFSAAAGSLQVVAVMPFYPRPEMRLAPDSDTTPDQVASLISTFVAEALAARGVHVIPPSDLALTFANKGRPLPRRDPLAAIETAAHDFGARSVVMGEVWRWRERRGEAYGADQPASVGFQLSLHDPQGRRLFSSRFDHTQRTLTADPLTARKYPGGGTRFLTAAELARWGAAAAAESLVSGQWRDSK